MKIIRAKTAGFCMGVDLALQKLDSTIKTPPQKNNRIVMLGPIIHNPQVIQKYKEQNVVCISSIKEVQPDDTVIIRAHGLPQDEESYLIQLGATIIDATCPKVKKAQLLIKKYTSPKKPLLLFGEQNHPEVLGLISYSNGPYFIFETIDQLKNPPFPLEPSTSFVLASQTTQDALVFNNVQLILTEQNIPVKILPTICNATHDRQEETLAITNQIEALVVVGGKSSGNTCRLADIGRKKNLPTWHIETKEELIDIQDVTKFSVIGLTAGASTPQQYINEVESFLDNTLPKH